MMSPVVAHPRLARRVLAPGELMVFVVRVLINALALWLATLIVSGFDVVGSTSTASKVGIFLLVGLVLGVVNLVVKPIVKALSLPIMVLTLGLFTVVVNALMLLLTAWITEHTTWGLRLEDFWAALLGSLVVSVVVFVLTRVLPRGRR